MTNAREQILDTVLVNYLTLRKGSNTAIGLKIKKFNTFASEIPDSQESFVDNRSPALET